MSCQNLAFTVKDHIGTVILGRPQIDLVVAYELQDVCNQINQDDEVWVGVITGLGEVFSVGSTPADPDAAEAASIASRALGKVLVPVIAALNGDAVGVGLELALTADIRLAVDRARFGMTQVSEGNIPAGGGTQRLSRIVGKGKALELILTADLIDAGEAHRIGLINQVVSSDDLGASTEALARKIADKGPIAERYSKEAIGKGLDMTLEQGLRLEADLSFLLQSTSDRDEGIKAFMEKRTPQFKGE